MLNVTRPEPLVQDPHSTVQKPRSWAAGARRTKYKIKVRRLRDVCKIQVQLAEHCWPRHEHEPERREPNSHKDGGKKAKSGKG